MVKIHLDTDIGGDPDDLCALAMLLKWPHVQLTGITTVSDDNGIRAGYTRYVLKIVGREDISVKAGTDISEGRYRPIPGIPNEKDYWPEHIAPLACAVALGWNGVTIEEFPLKFEIKDNLLHETIHPEGKKTRVVTKVESEKFNELWLKTVTTS